MGLKEELKGIIGNRRRFMLFRLCDVDTETARKLCSVPKGSYNSWLHDERFVEIYRRRDELANEYQKEALSLLRRDTQLSAVLLEEKIVQKMKEELETGEYNLIRTNLAKAVYEKLVGDLDYQPQALALSWEQRIQQLFTGVNTPPIEGGIINAELVEATGQSQTEHSQSQSITKGE